MPDSGAAPPHGFEAYFVCRSKENFDNRTCGPYWSEGWQAGSYRYTPPPIYFARDAGVAFEIDFPTTPTVDRGCDRMPLK